MLINIPSIILIKTAAYYSQFYITCWINQFHCWVKSQLHMQVGPTAYYAQFLPIMILSSAQKTNPLYAQFVFCSCVVCVWYLLLTACYVLLMFAMYCSLLAHINFVHCSLPCIMCCSCLLTASLCLIMCCLHLYIAHCSSCVVMSITIIHYN